MYPLNMHNKAAGGFALANDESEHKALSEQGYEPKFEQAAEEATPEKRKPGRPRKAAEE
jgi:hypothetical protein